MKAMFRVLGLASLICSVPLVWSGQEPLVPGTLLVASDRLGDPNFAETVVFITQRDADEGTMGLILNRPADTTLKRAFPSLRASSDPIYEGGPVAPDAVHALLKSSEKVEGAERIAGDVYQVSHKAALERMIGERVASNKFRVYLGYAGWGRGQLENEVRQGAWITLRAAKYVFDNEPASLWDRLIRDSQNQIAKAENVRMKVCRCFALLFWRC